MFGKANKSEIDPNVVGKYLKCYLSLLMNFNHFSCSLNINTE